MMTINSKTISIASESSPTSSQLVPSPSGTTTVNKTVRHEPAQQEPMSSSPQSFPTTPSKSTVLKDTPTTPSTTTTARLSSSPLTSKQESDDVIEDDETLMALARAKKRNRLDFFNGTRGKRLRLHVKNHIPMLDGRPKWCALCGLYRDGRRGHRSSHKCDTCAVNLCVKRHAGADMNCWGIWHSTTKLNVRSELATSPVPRTTSPTTSHNITQRHRHEEEQKEQQKQQQQQKKNESSHKSEAANTITVKNTTTTTKSTPPQQLNLVKNLSSNQTTPRSETRSTTPPKSVTSTTHDQSQNPTAETTTSTKLTNTASV